MARRAHGDRSYRAGLAACAGATLACCLSSAALAVMTFTQMQSLGGSALLQATADRLFANCGLPASIADRAGPDDARRSVSWRGTAMRLSAADWQIHYGFATRDTTMMEDGWVNREPLPAKCTSGVAWMALDARGRSGVLTATKKADGSGYVTTYRVSDNLYKAHKVVGIRVGLSSPIPVSTLIGRYGAPDAVLGLPDGRKRHRYWVLTRNGQRPDSLHAVDFETGSDTPGCSTYEIRAAGTDVVDEKLGSLLREWERDHVLD